MDDQSTQEVAVNERMMQFLGDDEEEIIEEEQEPVDAEEVADEEEEAPEPEVLELSWNGEQLKKTKEEVLELAQKGFDYTQKTQVLAEQRKTMQAQHQAMQMQMALQNQLIDKIGEVKTVEAQLAQFQQVDWNTLMDNDPIQAMKLDRQYRELQAQYQAKVGEVQQAAQHTQAQQARYQQEVLQNEYQSMLRAIPDWADGEKAKAERSELKSYLANSGFNEQEVEGVQDHRHVVIARKAMLYDKLIAQKPAVNKRVAEAPKPIRPGAKQQTNTKTKAYSEVRSQLKKSGNSDIAARAIEALL